MSSEQAGRGAKEGRGPDGEAPRAASGGRPRAEPDELSTASAGRSLLLVGGILAVFVGLVTAFILVVLPRSGAVPAGESTEQATRVDGVRCGYSIEAPAGWKWRDGKSLGGAASGDLDLGLVKKGGAATAFVMVEEIPRDLMFSPEAYFDTIVEMLQKNAPGTLVSEDEPLPRDPDNGVVARLQMPDEQGTRDGYVSTLLTPKWAIRIVATAPTPSFSSHRDDLRRIVTSLTPPLDSTPPRASFVEARRTPTKLRNHGPSPQRHKEEPTPAGVEEIHYDSGPLSLKAYFLPPGGAPSGKAPGLVYLHGGFAYGSGDLAVPRVFADAGFACLVPTYRGENGNPGEYELFRGELDDAAAAIKWLAARKGVDPGQIHVFGHSAGGGLAALVSLLPDVPVQSTGSAGGAFDESTFAGWDKDGLVPFDPLDRAEIRVRLLGPFLREMRRPHRMYVGDQDEATAEVGHALSARGRRLTAPLHVETLPGDHWTSLIPAAKRFLEATRKP